MLQQTQVTTVLSGGYYPRFLRNFPTVFDLADACDDALLKAWEGLGYYRRARMLRDLARVVVRDYGGYFPHEIDALMKLPGVGRYTAGAIRAFAFDQPSVLVDGNIARVISRLLQIEHPVDSAIGQSSVWNAAGDLACDRHPRIHHSALMELGQRICRPRVPDCQSCPVSAWCESRNPECLPRKRQPVQHTAIEEHVLFSIDSTNQILMHCEPGKRRQGLWKLPPRSEEAIRGLALVETERYTITRYKVTMKVFAADMRTRPVEAMQDEAWIPHDVVLQLAMPAPYRRVIARLMSA